MNQSQMIDFQLTKIDCQSEVTDSETRNQSSIEIIKNSKLFKYRENIQKSLYNI